MSLTTWDIETGTKAKFKRKGTPFGGLNHTVLHGWKHRNDKVEHHYFGRTPPGPGWLRQVLGAQDLADGARSFKTKLLAGFNIKFDLLHALQDETNLDLWMEYVARGGMLWDCQLAEYLLNGMGQREHMLSLDEVAPRYGGNLKVDEVKALWNAGVDTVDIDPDLLTRYLIGGPDASGAFQLGDIENTEKIALAQIDRARAAGQLNSILLNMGSLLCTVEMERNGMFVDVELGKQLAAELAVKITVLQEGMKQYLPQDMPFEFKWTSPFHKSALIFGGKVRWDAYEYDLADGTTILKHDYDALEVKPKRVYAQMDEVHYLLVDGTTMAIDEWDHRRQTQQRADEGEGCLCTDGTPCDPHTKAYLAERVVNKGGKNAGEAKTKKVKVDNPDKPKGRSVDAFYKMGGFTAPKPEWERSDYKGVYSVSSEVVEELGNRNIPFLKALAELQKLVKDLTTYYIVTDPETGESKGMLSLVDEFGIIHHRINHTNTVTGRFSSSDPNLQNISKGLLDPVTGMLVKGSQVKRVFVSRFGPTGKLIQSDFTALEVYVQAILTRCSQLIDDLKAGLDMHCVRVSQKEGMPYDEVLKLCKGYKADDGAWVDAIPEWDAKRTKAKVFSFQRAYGAGAQKISDSTGMPLEEVEALIRAETERYPEIDEYYADITKTIKGNRKSTGYATPHPFVRGVMCNLGTSYIRTPDGKLYSYQEQPSPEYLCRKGIFQSFSPTEIKNYVAQGGGGEWAKAAMWLAIRAFYARRNWGGRALLVNQVHDAVCADAAAEVAAEAAAVLHACMEGASDFMEFYFKWNVPVPVPSDTTWGASMMDEERIPGVKDQAVAFRQELRDLYMGGYKPSFIQ